MTTFSDSTLKVFTKAIANGTVSLADRYDLLSALLDRDLYDTEIAAVDQLIQEIQQRRRIPATFYS